MNIPEKFWKVTMGALGLLAIFLLIVSIKELKSIGYVGVNDTVVNTITVDGTGDAVAIPDIATFSFTVTKTAMTVADAQKQATDATNAALKAVHDGGVADKDIQTTSYNINPHYDYQSGICTTAGNCRPGKSVLTGYDVSESVEVKIRNLSKAGDLFSSIGSLGVEDVNGLTFSVDKPDAVQTQARGVAITNAETKAKELASQLGVTLVRVISFSENNDNPSPIMYGLANSKAMVASAPQVSPEIPTGQEKVTSDVSITYEIK